MIELIILGGIIALIVRAVGKRGDDATDPSESGGVSLRRFFQYALLFTVVMIVAIGASGLLAELIPGETVIRRSDSTTARSIAFLIVGGPALYALARWVRRGLADEDDRQSFAWAAYLGVAAITGLITAATGALGVAEAALGGREFEPVDLSRLIVWGAVWYLHYRLAEHEGRTGRLRLHLLGGSLVGLIMVAVAAGFGLSTVLERIYLSLFGGSLISDFGGSIRQAFVGLVIGGAIWVRYWLTVSVRLERDSLWHGYVLLAGVLGGLITAVTGLAMIVFTVLDWFVTGSRPAAAGHFDTLPGALTALGVGGALWLYHTAVLRSKDPAARAEVDRVHDYLVSAVGLVAAAAGLAIVVVAVVQSLLPGDVVSGGDEASTVVWAITLLVVGGPLWWRTWSAIQRERALTPQVELSSPSRRIYLFALFGIGGVVALVSLLTLVVRLLEDMFEGGFGSETIYGIRVAVALVVTVGAVAAYHWAVHKEDRATAAEVEDVALAVRFIVLVSAGGGEVAKVVNERTGVRVRVWERPDAEVVASADEVVAAIETGTHDRLLVIARESGLEVLPYTEQR